MKIKIRLRHIVLSGIFLLCLVFSLVIYLICRGQISDLEHQTMAERWSSEGGYAQESLFYNDSGGFDANEEILRIRAEINAALTEESIEGSYEERTWLDAYSTFFTTTLSTDNNFSCQVTMAAVGGDFFKFHPFKLINGSYFAETDLMHDLVVIDKLTAWNLYGSNDCIGMRLYINDLPYIVTGVVESVECEADKLAYGSGAMAFMSYDVSGDGRTVQCYEALLPNPIPDFANGIVEKVLSPDESSSVLLENTGRFGVERIWQVLKAMPTRSMQTNGIAYPYWENAARLTETRLAFEYMAIALLLIYPLVCVVIIIILLWKHKKWNISDVKTVISDRAYSLSCARAARGGKYSKQKQKRKPKHLKARKDNEKAQNNHEYSADTVYDTDDVGVQ